jgi:hypothetical protein
MKIWLKVWINTECHQVFWLVVVRIPYLILSVVLQCIAYVGTEMA